MVVMGVAGSGKTTVATELAGRLHWPQADADDFHPEANKQKMSSGHELSDADRQPWLAAIRDWIGAQVQSHEGVVVTCSALKVAYRDVLRQAEARVRFVQLDGSADLLRQRIAARRGHFMPASMLDSQLATFEPLGPEEDGVVVSISRTPDAIASDALTALGLAP